MFFEKRCFCKDLLMRWGTEAPRESFDIVTKYYFVDFKY